MFKLYGYYALPWNATAGAFVVAQSGQPWEAWSYEPYVALTTSTSDVNRYAEPAGSRTQRLALAARPELHPELPARRQPEPAARRRPVQRLRQADRLQLPAAVHASDFDDAADRSSIRGGSSWRRGCSSRSRSSTVTDLTMRAKATTVTMRDGTISFVFSELRAHRASRDP